ncbi:MAG: hypothetical protein SFU25_11520, partial [Candidatus Caenarcaniphilales bacterium]|nr:hypothetical protein [Candidatus Caenarcaniphilales bacterium]
MFALQYKKKLAALLISSFCALYSFTFGQSDSSAIQAQVNYLRVIKALREEVANNQKAFILQFSNKDNAQAFLERHRSLLGENIFQTIQKGTSSEAILAIHQSYNDFLLHKINLIEAQLGQKEGLYSTRWNILSTEDLTLLQGHASEQLKLVKIELGKYPNSTAPIELKSRDLEIKNWVDEITQELQTRKSSPHLKLVEIENNVSESKMTVLNKVLSAFEGESGKQKFQIKLKFNLQLRLHGVANPSLESVTQLVNTSLETPEAEGIKLHDPQRGPPSTWENPYKDVKNIIKKASFQEFEALIFKDYYQLAEARSTKLLYQRWLQLSTEGNLKPISEFAYLEAFDLLELKQHYKNWYKAQLKAPLAQNTTEITETQKAITEINRQLSWPKNSSRLLDPDIILPLDRGPPPPDFSPAGGGANPDSPTGKMSDEILEAKVKGALKKTDLIDYEAKMPSIQQRLKLVELKKTLDRPSTIPDPNLRKQYNDLKNEILSTAKGKNQDLVLKELGQAQEKFAKSTSSITDFIQTIKKTLQDIQGRRRVLLSSEPENIIQKKDIPFSKRSIVSESQNDYPEQFNKLFPKNATN